MNPNNQTHPNTLAKTLFDFLYLREEISVADAVMGFGHFDEKIPVHCGSLYTKGYARLIIFSGGVGAGSTGLNKAEAQVFSDKLFTYFPEIQLEKVILEDQSTNTGENIQFTFSLLNQKHSELLAPNGIKKLVLVANAYRQRRVWLTCRKHIKNIELINSPPDTSFEQEREMFEKAGENFLSHLVNEIEKIKAYPTKGYIVHSRIPDEIIQAYEQLKRLI